jgi:hypothetical protein
MVEGRNPEAFQSWILEVPPWLSELAKPSDWITSKRCGACKSSWGTLISVCAHRGGNVIELIDLKNANGSDVSELRNALIVRAANIATMKQ